MHLCLGWLWGRWNLGTVILHICEQHWDPLLNVLGNAWDTEPSVLLGFLVDDLVELAQLGQHAFCWRLVILLRDWWPHLVIDLEA